MGRMAGVSWTPHGPEDLTGRARIRDAAIALFAERGFAGASLRDIAEAAQVSAGLVRHHFGSKDGLRQACDTYVLAFLRRGAADGVVAGQVADADFVAALHRTAPQVQRYLARALTDGSPAGAALFDEIVAITEQALAARPASRGTDLRARAAVLTAMKLGITVLHEHVSRALGADALAPGTWPRVTGALLDVVSPDLVETDTTAHLRARLAEPGPDSRTDR